uniref:Uncharacterized protein n=1 Tax=Phytophthora ramorum TaxID=164328 RepID=H3GTR0_PHYRM
MTSWPPFSAAVLVTRECLPAALPHVTLIISDFLDALGREGVFAAAIRRGDSERELSYLFKRDPTPLSQHMVRHAAAAGHTHVLKWIKHHQVVDKEAKSLWSDYNFNPMDEAAKHGHVKVLQWLHDHASGCRAGRASSWAASNGHLEAVKWLHLYREDLGMAKCMDFGAANGHVHVVKWLHDNRKDGCSTWAMDGAATNGHLEVVRWLHSNRREGCTKAAIHGAAAQGRLQVVQYLLQSVRPKDEMQWFGWAFNSATDNGHVIVAEWVYTTYHEHLSESVLALALSAAIDNGHNAMAQWLLVQQSELR